MINGRSFSGYCLVEVRKPLWGRVLPHIGKMRFKCARGRLPSLPHQAPELQSSSRSGPVLNCENTSYNLNLLVPVLFDLPGYHGNYKKRQFTILKTESSKPDFQLLHTTNIFNFLKIFSSFGSLALFTIFLYCEFSCILYHFSVAWVPLQFIPFFSSLGSSAFYTIFQQPGFSCILYHFSVPWVPLQFVTFFSSLGSSAVCNIFQQPGCLYSLNHFSVSWVPMHFIPFFNSLGSPAV